MSEYSGISEKVILQNNLAVPFNYFWKDLLREKGGYTVGRLDSRYKGIDAREAGDNPDYNSELTSWLHSFTPAINYYLQEFFKEHKDFFGIFLETAHPVKFLDTVEDAIGQKAAIPEAIQGLMTKEKIKISIKDYQDLKQFLID